MIGRSGSRAYGIVAAGTLAVAFSFGAPNAGAQDTQELRPVPAAVDLPGPYQRALDRGWRSADGSPGHSYWQQGTSYDITARLDPETATLEGSVRIRYANNAPATLGSIWLHLRQNLHKAGSPRNEPQEITGGVTLKRVAADGEELQEGALGAGPSYRVRGTLMELRPSAPVEEGDTLELEIDWEVTLPQDGAGRMGHSGQDVYMVAYWFPKVAVFDNLRGWDAQPYLGQGEFYDGFSDYTAALTVPTGWTVMATGTLENPQEVFSALTRDRLALASVADTLVMIAGDGERAAGTVTAEAPSDSLTYRFRATNVRDFAWTTSNVQRWDATSALVPDRDDDGAEDRVLINSFWREDRAPLWSRAWEYGKQAVEHHSRATGLSYPWPHMTLVEGADIIEGGMEFPMVSLIGTYQGRDDQALFATTSHEIGHMWVPMIVGTNENRYAWMDEGSATFLEDQSLMDIWPGVDHFRIEGRNYLQAAAAGSEQTMMRQADYYEPGPGYSIASYSKPSTLMVALREIMGHDKWDEAYRAFLAEWAYKQPTPWDFFNTFERFAGQDLDWFWTSFYYETWTLDQAVANVVTHQDGGATIIIEDIGNAPFPTVVRIRTTGGGVIERTVPVEEWLRGATRNEIEIPADAGRITRVEIDPSGYAPDVDRSNNIWPRG